MLAMFSIAPHSGETHLSTYVAQMIRKVRDSGLDYELTAMGTLVEGEPDQVFELIRECHKMVRKQASRVGTKIWIDDQVGQTGRLKDKVKSVLARLEDEADGAQPG
jgi:uncharacterized protein (TIGR00106 family)